MFIFYFFLWQAPLSKAELMKIPVSVGGYGTEYRLSALNFHFVAACSAVQVFTACTLYIIHQVWFTETWEVRRMREVVKEQGKVIEYV